MRTIDIDLCSIQEARDLVKEGKAAADTIASFSDEQINAILQQIVKAVEANAYRLAEMAVEETGFARLLTKLIKIMPRQHCSIKKSKQRKPLELLTWMTRRKFLKWQNPWVSY